MGHLEALRQRVLARLVEWEAAGLKRSLRPPSGIDLSSNDYLGLATHPRLVRRFVEALRIYGCGATASRLLRGHREIFTDVERRFAAFKGTEAALYFASGYAANLGVLTTFLESGDVVFSDERNHASLIDGMRLTRAARHLPASGCSSAGALAAFGTRPRAEIPRHRIPLQHGRRPRTASGICCFMSRDANGLDRG